MPVLLSEDEFFADCESHLYNETGRSVYTLRIRVW